jgi:alkylation response protein AidB-like acyl-CoA dehydrogenase
VHRLIELAREAGRLDDPAVRDGIARLHCLVEISGWHLGRMKSGNAMTGGEGNLAKLRNSDMVRLARDLGCQILGPHAMLTGPESRSGGDIQELTVFSPAPSIYGGTDEVQRNIIGERVLGLAKEPDATRGAPFRGTLVNGARPPSAGLR